MKRIERIKDNIIIGLVSFLGIILIGLSLTSRRNAPEPQPNQQRPSSDYVTRDEVHQIVDSILIQIYD